VLISKVKFSSVDMRGPELLTKFSLIILDLRFRKMNNFFFPPDISVILLKRLDYLWPSLNMPPQDPTRGKRM
jgi:hypothetical protein